MKHISLTFSLLVLFIFSSSAQQTCVDGQCFSASLNDTSFQFRNYWPMNATLSKQQGSMNGKKPERTIISLVLNGTALELANGKSFSEGIQVEIAFEQGKLAAEPTYTVYMQYKSGLYTLNTAEGVLKVTSFELQADQHSYRLSAELNCSMQSWTYPVDSKDALPLKLNLTNILIASPDWLVAKL